MTLIPVNSFPARRISAILCLFGLLLTTALYCHGSDTGSQDFHSYKAIETNVTFWEKIYSHYSLTEAVIHDSEDLSKIYEIIPLLGDDLPGASRFNTLFQRQAINKYRKILKKLTTQQPTTREEKRVAALFSQKNRRKELHLALDNVRSQRGQKERFLSGVLHSGKYMGEIKRIFRAYDLPEELAYLPHVESSFNFKAYSKYGAAGIWQFTRSTGKQYLTIDYTLDERLDPIIATHAAARYLENSYQTLNDWPLAITSYNYGLSGMVRAVAELGGYERIFKHYNRGRFGFASKNFYPEFLAAVKVARKIEKNLKDKLEPAQKTRYINLAGYIHINDACRYFGISTETLVSLNPALRPPVIRGEKHIPKGYVLRLPKERKTTRLAASIPQSLYKAAQKPSPYHRVQKGDTAGSIAR